MKTVAYWILSIGFAWFTIAMAAMILLILIEYHAGVTVVLPKIGGIEWLRLLVYFGCFGGSWCFIVIGIALLFVHSLLHPVDGSKR